MSVLAGGDAPARTGSRHHVARECPDRTGASTDFRESSRALPYRQLDSRPSDGVYRQILCLGVTWPATSGSPKIGGQQSSPEARCGRGAKLASPANHRRQRLEWSTVLYLLREQRRRPVHVLGGARTARWCWVAGTSGAEALLRPQRTRTTDHDRRQRCNT